MSGHSHAKTILHKKQATDAQKGKTFSKVAHLITLAAKTGGDPTTNHKLRLAIERAKILNMPKDNVQRAIDRGTGKIAGEKIEEVIFEGFGSAGTAIIIEGITDNKNRTLSEIKQIFNQNGGKLGGEGSVKWLFERKGAIIINFKIHPAFSGTNVKKEDLELAAIGAGAEDIYWHAAPEGGEPRQEREDLLDVYTKPEDLEKVKKNLEEKGIKIESASLDWVAKKTIEVDEKDKEACQKLFEALDENDAVQDIYSNLKV